MSARPWLCGCPCTMRSGVFPSLPPVATRRVSPFGIFTSKSSNPGTKGEGPRETIVASVMFGLLFGRKASSVHRRVSADRSYRRDSGEPAAHAATRLSYGLSVVPAIRPENDLFLTTPLSHRQRRRFSHPPPSPRRPPFDFLRRLFPAHPAFFPAFFLTPDPRSVTIRTLLRGARPTVRRASCFLL